jgi:hypothetical protein
MPSVRPAYTGPRGICASRPLQVVADAEVSDAVAAAAPEPPLMPRLAAEVLNLPLAQPQTIKRPQPEAAVVVVAAEAEAAVVDAAGR